MIVIIRFSVGELAGLPETVTACLRLWSTLELKITILHWQVMVLFILLYL